MSPALNFTPESLLRLWVGSGPTLGNEPFSLSAPSSVSKSHYASFNSLEAPQRSCDGATQ